MGLRHNNFVWDLFSQAFGVNWFYGGEILLSYGDWSVQIHTKTALKNVWLSINEPEESIPVCCGDLTVAGARVFPDHALINAKVRSDIVVLHYWFQF